MKTHVALLASLVVALVAAAQTAPPPATSSGSRTRIVLPDDPPATKAGDKSATGKSADAAKKDGKAAPKSAKKEEPKIEGLEIPRGGDRGFLGLQMVNSTFKLSFYDKAKKPMNVDAARAVVRWDPKYKVGQDRVVLNPSDDGKSLTSPKNIRPPHQFKLFITLLKSAAEDAEPTAGETFVVDFKG